MQLKILLFGITRQVVGESLVTVTMEEESTVEDLIEYFEKNYDELNNLSSLVVAVNNEFAEKDQTLQENDEIALIPPVSGG